MAVTINGSGTITGVSTGGLPDGIVDADMLATSAVTSAKILDATIASGDLASGVGGVDGIVSSANATAITIDSAENVGIGVTPSAWNTNWTALQIGGMGSISSYGTSGDTTGLILSSNAYLNTSGAWSHIGADQAAMIDSTDGKWTFKTGGSSAGTTGSAISWTTAMTISNAGKVGLGTVNPDSNIHVIGTGRNVLKITDASNYTMEIGRLGSSGEVGFITTTGTTAELAFGTYNGTERFRILNNGYIKSVGIYNQSASDSANVHIDGAGNLYRATSSIKYKKNVETMEDSYADAILGLRSVWYRSKQELDNPEWGYWGFIAEEVAEIDPRLVDWRRTRVEYDEGGMQTDIALDTPEAEGVQYDRIVPHLVNLLKRQASTIEDLTARIEVLEAQ